MPTAMMTKDQKAKETTTPPPTTNEGWTRETGGFPPMLLLEVGGKLEGQITQVDVQIKKEKQGRKVRESERIYYRVALSSSASGLDGKSKEKVSFNAGEVITLPGSGSLDNTFGRIALKMEGKADSETAEPNYQELVGLMIRVKRTPDEKMKKGAFQGKMVKTYDVEWKRPD